MKEKIRKTILGAVRELYEDIGLEVPAEFSLETRLYGEGSLLDSIALVTLIVDLEEKLADQFERNLVLADERAMSRTHSPFRSIGTLVDYIEALLTSELAQA